MNGVCHLSGPFDGVRLCSVDGLNEAQEFVLQIRLPSHALGQN
jgi:hypothetical protein